MYARIVISNFISNFNHKFNILNMSKKKLNRLKLVLVEKEKTGIWLADQLGVSSVTVSKWCNNVNQPTVENLIDIARVLEVNVNELLRV